MRSAALQANDWTRWEFITLAIKQWYNSEGRFFPVSTIENVYMFDFIHSVSLYKFLQLLVTTVLLLVAATFIAKLLGSSKILPLAIFVLLSCLQTRNWYDPTLGFGLLLQSAQIKVLFCLYCLIKFLQIEGRKSYFYLTASVLLWILALLQYEVVITLVPSILILLIVFPGKYRRKSIACGIFSVITVVYIWGIFQIRAGVTASAAYTIDYELETVALTYFKQLSGGVPFSAIIWSKGATSLTDALNGLPFFMLLLLVAITVLTVQSRSIFLQATNRSVLILLVIGLNFCFGPGITTALSVRWQNEVTWGLSYLSVSFFYTGFAFVSISMLVFGLKLCCNRLLTSKLLFFLFAGFFAMSAVSNLALLNRNVNASKLGKEHRALYESAIRQGFFSTVPDESVVVFPFYDENSWVNSYFTEWLGGPRGLSFVRSLDDAKVKCDLDVLMGPCSKVFLFEYVTTSRSRTVLSLIELDNKVIESQYRHRYFGNDLHSEDFTSLCFGEVEEKTEYGTIFLCFRSRD